MASEILVQGKNVHHTELRSLEMSHSCHLKSNLSLDPDTAFAVLGYRGPGEDFGNVLAATSIIVSVMFIVGSHSSMNEKSKAFQTSKSCGGLSQFIIICQELNSYIHLFAREGI